MKPDPTDLLLPRPHAAQVTGERCPLPARPTIGLESPHAEAATRRLEAKLAGLGLDSRRDASPEDATLRLRHRDLGREAYRLSVGLDGVEVAAGDAAGLLHGVATLGQWFDLHHDAPDLPGLVVEDRPDFPVRGALLDVSRDKVPRLETLFELVDLLASFKVNHLQLYTEHTFAYRGHETVWQNASPLTPGDVRRLAAFCAERQVELAANQQSFGHFHRWLVHEPYRRLAECPEGVVHPFSDVPEPFSLCPTDPGSLELLADLYGQLLPCFESPLLNAGLDETLDLGLGRSKALCEARGRERVYLDFLKEVHALAATHGRRMQLWGDIILKRPELIAELPEDVIALEWGYEADHPFAEDGRAFAAASREFWVCPGTSSWQSFAGRTRNALLNLARAAVHGYEHGATGYLVTDWGDYGHLQPLPVSYPGLVAGAGFAWNVDSARKPDDVPLAEVLDRHVFDDRAGVLGRLLLDLGDTYRLPGPPPMNGSALFSLTVFALRERERERVCGVTVSGLERALAHVEHAAEPLAAARPARGAEILGRELAWLADVLRFACRLGIARWRSGDLETFDAIPAERRRHLGDELRSLVEGHREVVLGRHREGGLEASASRLLRVARRLDSLASL